MLLLIENKAWINLFTALIVWRSWFIENDSSSSLNLVLSSHLQLLQDFISEISGGGGNKIYEPRDCKTRSNNERRNDFTITEIGKDCYYSLLNSVLLLLQHCYGVLDGGYQFFTHANFNWIGESKEQEESSEWIHCVYLNFTNNLFIWKKKKK